MLAILAEKPCRYLAGGVMDLFELHRLVDHVIQSPFNIHDQVTSCDGSQDYDWMDIKANMDTAFYVPDHLMVTPC